MASTVGQVMARNPISVSADSLVSEVARKMADDDVGVVVVTDDHGRVVGICTDRDITVRVTAANRGPDTTVGATCSNRDLGAVTPDTAVSDAAALMREKAVRRLLVLEGEQLVGVVSVGDLAMDRDPDSVLADISAADPNR
jgi:CBS domain-containing protein